MIEKFKSKLKMEEGASDAGTKPPKVKMKYIIWGLSIMLFIMLYNSATVNVGSSESVRIQNNLTGDYKWVQREGIHLKLPFFSQVARYNSVSTIAITDDQVLIDTASAVRPPLAVAFADNYGGLIEVSFRAKLPTDNERLEYMHQDVKSQTNLEGNTYLTFARDMINLTTDQFLAQDFMQGGKGAFKQRLQEQSDQGMRVTKREKVEVQGQVADQTLKSDRSQASTAKQFVYKVVSQTDKDGKLLRRPHSLAKYGITITQVDLGEFKPNPDLETYVNTIKKRERERADTIAEQRIERDKAVTEQLKGDRERITAKNKALMEKDREVIQGQKQVELAKIQAEREKVEKQKEADLSKIQKQKELDIAKANEGIQMANEKSAKYEAQAKLHNGLAEAKIKREMYQAINKEIFYKEVERDIQLAKYTALPNVKLNMPTNVMMTGGVKGTSSIEDLANISIVDRIGQLK